MAVTLALASLQTFAASGVPVSAVPLTLACWYKPASLPGSNQTLICLDDGSASNFFALRVTATTGTINATCTPSGSASTVSAASVGTWVHCGAVFASTTSRTPYLNGTAGAADTSSQSTGT